MRASTGGARQRRAAVLIGPMLLAGLAACDSPRGWDREALGRAYFDSTGTYVHAGISTRAEVDVAPLDAATLGPDSTSRSHHLYAMRCGSCHEAPDPSMKAREHWFALVRRMQNKTRTAGVIPLSDPEADSILAFLQRHSRPSRPSP